MSPVIGFRRGLRGHPTDLPPFAYAWLEAPLAAKLARLEDVPEWTDPEIWPAGRIFGEAGEYRWQRRADGTLHAVALFDSAPLPAGFQGPIALEPDGAADFVLWGDWVDPARDRESNPQGGPLFYASEIPEPQRYPVDGDSSSGRTARLQVRRYRDPAGEHGELIRCAGFRLSPAGERDDG